MKSQSNTDSIWLTIYADMITNLLLLFLALFGLTMLGQDALVQAMMAMKSSDLDKYKSVLAQDDFELISTKLKADLSDVPVSISQHQEVVNLEFGEGILFPLGRSETKISAESVLLRVASILREVPYTVIVEGHTDSVPLSGTGRYRNNQELSMARAMSIVRWLSDKGGIPEAQLAAASYGEFKPRSSNLTESGRRMNRRVEIILMKEFPYVR